MLRVVIDTSSLVSYILTRGDIMRRGRALARQPVRGPVIARDTR